MRSEALVITAVAVFATVVTPIYWFMSNDWTGTSALVMTALLGFLLAFFLGVLAKQIPTRPEDNKEGDISDGAGELGFFPPFSWWPLAVAAAFAVFALGVAIGWWLAAVGLALSLLAIMGYVFEYYRGLHAH
ncbi:MAG: Cytochrome c oxidase polypeptide IV [uncultured Nocardioidaceae bacterium]|uniref:Cytochrome c oxidase polypeptide 4 n=1 Tax=uncultured Nocardioidaceae bacterium TaxID=253824 RepID=A0A6J4LCQ4_9ACTN|nr:MAG: Cytochrome c oxidase polypeptide IV [uncultured Nocardioidaceae bacterium]